MNDAASVRHVTCPTPSLARFALTDPNTVQQLVKQLKSMNIYCFPQSSCRVPTNYHKIVVSTYFMWRASTITSFVIFPRGFISPLVSILEECCIIVGRAYLNLLLDSLSLSLRSLKRTSLCSAVSEPYHILSYDSTSLP